MADKMKITFTGGPFDGEEEMWTGEESKALHAGRYIACATVDATEDDEQHIKDKIGKARFHLYYMTGLGDSWSIWTYDKSFNHSPTPQEIQDTMSKSPIKKPT
jgi:hypothetical protein